MFGKLPLELRDVREVARRKVVLLHDGAKDLRQGLYQLCLFLSVSHECRHLVLEIANDISVSLAEADSLHQLVDLSHRTRLASSITDQG